MSAAETLQPGDVIADRYRVLRVLGDGGAGTVYAAQHTWTRREVALKVIAPERSASEVVSARFFREARALSTLRHPNVVQVLDMGQDESDGALYLAQELLVGEDLRARLTSCGRIDPVQAARWLTPIAEALAHAHAAGILHRDVKPANIFLQHTGEEGVRPVLIDFGVARAIERDPSSTLQTEHGLPVGTPRYMAPEQVRGDLDLDSRVDVWAMGAVLFECVTGRPAFDAASPATVYAQILNARPPSARQLEPDLPAPLAATIDRALAFDRVDRFPSMTELHAALARFCDDPGATIAPPGPPRRSRLAALAAVLVLALVASGWSLRPRGDAPPTAAHPSVVRAVIAASPRRPLAPRAVADAGASRRPIVAIVTPARASPPRRAPRLIRAPSAAPTAPPPNSRSLQPVDPTGPTRRALEPVEP